MKEKKIIRRIVNIAAVPPPIGGIASFLKRLKAYTDNQSDSVDYIFVDTSSVDVKEKKAHGYVCIRKWQVPFYLLHLPSSIIVFHSNSIVHLVLNILFAWKHRFVYFTHGESILKQKNRKGWRHSVLRKSRYIVTPTEELYEEVRNIFPGKKEIAYIPFILYSPTIEKLSNDRFDDLRGRVDFIFSAYANSLKDYKGYQLYGIDMLIDFIYRIRMEGYNAGIYLILTSVDDENRLEILTKKIEELNLQDYFVISTETIEDGSSLFASSDIYVRPTNTDGDAFSIWEALYVGIPVLASDATQRPNGCTLFKTRDLEDMVSAGINILSDYPTQKANIEALEVEGNEKKLIDFFYSVMEI